MMHTALPLFIPFCLLFLHFHHSTCSSTTTASDDDDNKPNNYTIDYSSPLWNNGTIEEIYDLLDCDDNIAEWDPDDVKIYDSHSWSILFETYKDIVEDDNDEEVKEWKWRDSGFQIPHVVLINQWGRGVYADADIPEGSLVYKCLNTICIDDPDDVRRLLKNVPSDLACEILHWAYIYEPKEDEELDENEEPYQNAFCLEFDDGALLNDAMSTNAINLVNDRCFPPQIESDEAECEYRATRDIHRGEELLVSYKEFTEDNHTAVGL